MTLLLIAHFILIFVFTLRILLRDNLSPPGRLAWFIVINVLPYVGCVLYFLFGEVDLGNGANKRYAHIFMLLRQANARTFGSKASIAGLIDPNYQPAFAYAASVNGFYPSDGNRAELMEDANVTRQCMVADIEAAEERVHVLYYIWLEDETGQALAQALIRAATRGVTCRVMADGLGSRALIKSDLWQSMKDAGVQLAVALPLDNLTKTILTSRVDLRNHRKITIIDDKITYCGSRNSADPEFRIKAKFAPWVDIMLRFEGPVVAQNQLLFASDWMATTNEAIEMPDIKPMAGNGGFAAQVFGDGPTERQGATPQLFSGLIASARSQIVLSTPYFVPDATVLEALCAAAHRGVSVSLILPKVNDSWIVAAASRSYYRKLLKAGCQIHEFKGGLLHAKTLTIDSTISLIGSSNLDLRSFDLNYENNILLQDEAITAAIRDRQYNYISRSEPETLDAVLKWGYLQRIWHNIVATVGPVL